MAKRLLVGKQVGVFYAFPAEPLSIAETIQEALKGLKTSDAIKRSRVRFKPWTSMAGNGKQLMRVVTQDISRSAVFACDLTFPNFNVTFELGYAISQFKRLWVSLNTGYASAQDDYRQMYAGLLGGLVYQPYTNRNELADSLTNQPPWADLEETLLGAIHRELAPRQERPSLLYVKPPLDTDSVIAAFEVLLSSVFQDGVIIDDAVEMPFQPLEWYAEKIRNADAVVVQLLADDQLGARSHNMKSSFVAGLAYGFRKPILMVAPTPFTPPADYRTLLATHDSAEQCSRIVSNWIAEVEQTLPKRRARRAPPIRDREGGLDLRDLFIGEAYAENEKSTLDEYFLETAAYYHAFDKPTSIIIGRRGSGKTAILYSIRNARRESNKNHVCIIKPVGYETEGLVRVLTEGLRSAERGYLIESLWKFLIFSEMARTVSTELEERPMHIVRTPDEQKLIEYVYQYRDSLFAPFSERLDKAVRGLVGVSANQDPLDQRTKISELLHNNELKYLREMLGVVLEGRENVSVLIDGLDDPWGPGRHVQPLAELLFGLLKVAGDITEEFEHQDHWRRPVKVQVAVFLRSDIFAFIQSHAREQDKLPIERVVWNDPSQLWEVLRRRLDYASPLNYDGDTVWAKLFPEEVVGIPTWDFVLRSVLKRPRDVIYLVAKAIDGAINHGRQAVLSDDFLEARSKYSEFVFRSVLKEDDPSRGKLEDVLYTFANAPKVLPLSQLQSRIAAKASGASEAEFYIDLLCDIGFLGIQTRPDEFTYVEDEGERQIMRKVAAQAALNRGSNEEFYEINPAFYQILRIE